MLLVVNAGSSSVKVALYRGLTQTRKAQIGEIGPGGHRAALESLLSEGFGTGLTAVAHRVVHGGTRLTQACRIDPAVLAEIVACLPLAPLHNPANLSAIRAVTEITPDLPQYASFDTGFHATNPQVALRYALPPELEADGLRRYGFHGLSYAAIVRKLPELTGQPLPRRLLALHLGNGASACAILDGQSQASTMGYSPLDGLTMGTRVGSIDGNAVLRIAELHGVEAATRILNRESGLLGLGGSNDMRALHAKDTDAARFAIQHFCYWAVRHAGSMIAAMGGLDAIVFTGGIGENDAHIRGEILHGLAFIAAGKAVFVMEADEETQIAAEAMTLMQNLPAP